MPDGIKKNQKLEEPVLTPTTKSDEHDEKISGEEIVKRSLMTQKQWDFVSEKSLPESADCGAAESAAAVSIAIKT